jgi:hypothetical protein
MEALAGESLKVFRRGRVRGSSGLSLVAAHPLRTAAQSDILKRTTVRLPARSQLEHIRSRAQAEDSGTFPAQYERGAAQMSNESQLAQEFIKKQEEMHKENARIHALIRKYKNAMPDICALWDTSEACVDYNEPPVGDYTIYSCSLDALWAGIYKPAVYGADTLWDGHKHRQDKIANVIEKWEAGKALSPIFLVKHGAQDLALVADGKHRLTVARSIRAEDVRFMVETAKLTWVLKAFPSATPIGRVRKG